MLNRQQANYSSYPLLHKPSITLLLLVVSLVLLSLPFLIYATGAEVAGDTMGTLQVHFAAEHRLVLPGQCVLLTWDAPLAKTVFLNDQAVIVTGNQHVCPSNRDRQTLRVISIYGTEFKFLIYTRVLFGTPLITAALVANALLMVGVILAMGYWGTIPWLSVRLRRVHIRVRLPKRVVWWASRLGVSVGTLLVIGLLVEGYFEYFFAQSDTITIARSAQNWYHKYWNPLNEMGYRDISVQANISRRNVLFSGDSFVAGMGLEQLDHRMANVLAAHLGDQYAVRIVAMPGWSTTDELDGLKNYPLKPDAVLLGYYVDDIFGDMPPGTFQYGSTIPEWAKYSATINYAYWVIRGLDPVLRTRFDSLINAYNDPDLFAKHTAHLLVMRDWAHENNACFVVLLFPYAGDYTMSQGILKPIKAYLDSIHVPYLDVTPLIDQLPLRDIQASPRDLHFGEKVNSLIGDKVADQFFAPGTACAR